MDPVPYTVDELCELYLNEDIHTEQVTRLALQLFDATQPWTKLNRHDRRLLEAAARLHDIGYALDPRNHMRKSVELVREHTVEGFQGRQMPYILGAIALHQNAYRPIVRSPIIRNLAHPLRAMRIGALLRIADGLDQSHIQDSVIHDIRLDGKQIVIKVDAPLSPDNIARAEAKAMLWREVFDYDITFVAAPADANKAQALLAGHESLYEGIRRPVYWLFKQMRALEGGVKAGVATDPLHDLRVYQRRLRVLLKFFRKPLRDTWADDIEKRLSAISDALGPARDYDVWRERLDALEKAQDTSKSRVWKRYRAHIDAFRGEHLAQVRRVLNSARYKNCMQEIAYFLRIQLPQLAIKNPDRALVPFVSKKLAGQAQKLIDAPIPGGEWDAEDFHDFRKACRRGRYVAETYGPIIGPRTLRWGRVLKQMADALGDLHDADVGLERIVYDALPAPRVLAIALSQQRNDALRRTDAAWATMKTKRPADKLMKELQQARG